MGIVMRKGSGIPPWAKAQGLPAAISVTNSVTVKDVALHAGVSLGTVSRVLNNHKNVNEDLRQRVLRSVAELGYFRSVTQTQARPEALTLREIGFLHVSLKNEASLNSFWANILHGAEMQASVENARVTYRNLQSRSDTSYRLLRELHTLRLDGILLVGPAEVDMISAIHNMGIPLVLVDNYSSEHSLDAVLSDNFEGSIQAVSYLINAGHRRIAFIDGPTLAGARMPNKVYTIERRATGYRAALYQAGYPLDDALVEESDLTSEGGYQACKRLLARNIPFSAIFCANDPAAIGVMKALHESGRRIPGDVSVIGFDDFMAEHLTPALTTVRVNKKAMGVAAVKALQARMADPQAANITITVRVELVKRDSVSPHKESD